MGVTAIYGDFVLLKHTLQPHSMLKESSVAHVGQCRVVILSAILC